MDNVKICHFAIYTSDHFETSRVSKRKGQAVNDVDCPVFSNRRDTVNRNMLVWHIYQQFREYI